MASMGLAMRTALSAAAMVVACLQLNSGVRHPIMPFPDDVVTWVNRHFSGGDVESALATLGLAVDNTGELVSPRLLRCAAVGSRGTNDCAFLSPSSALIGAMSS